MNFFPDFLLRALNLVSPLFWWALAGMISCGLNLVFEREIWPGTPAAITTFTIGAAGCALLLPWLGAYSAWVIADAVQGAIWPMLWRLMAVVGFGGAIVSTFFGLVVLALAM